MLQLLSNLVKIAQMFGHDVLRHRLVLAVDDVHVQLSFAALDDGAQLGGILDAVVKGFEENAGNEARKSMEIRLKIDKSAYSRCHS